MLDSLSANAYGMYIVHYLFVVWLQFALLNAALPAVGKVADRFRWDAGDELDRFSRRRRAIRRPPLAGAQG